MNEVKIQIPDNCELIKDGDTYIVREKKQEPPRSWKEFCERYPLRDEYIIWNDSIIESTKALGLIDSFRSPTTGRNWCTSKEEAKAFLALMQLRQLRKAWVGDWKPIKEETAYGLVSRKDGSIEIGFYESLCRPLLFPTKEMAEEFLNCFRDLCEIAKILL